MKIYFLVIKSGINFQLSYGHAKVILTILFTLRMREKYINNTGIYRYLVNFRYHTNIQIRYGLECAANWDHIRTALYIRTCKRDVLTSSIAMIPWPADVSSVNLWIPASLTLNGFLWIIADLRCVFSFYYVSLSPYLTEVLISLM